MRNYKEDKMEKLTPMAMQEIAENHLEGLGRLEFYSGIHILPETAEFSVYEDEDYVALERFRKKIYLIYFLLKTLTKKYSI